MAQTQGPMGSSPLAMANQMQGLGAATPQIGDRMARMQQNLSSIQGMQGQIPPGQRPLPPGQELSGWLQPTNPQGPVPGGVGQQMQQMPTYGRFGPPRGAPGVGAGGQKNPAQKQQIAQLPGAPAR